MTQQTSLLTVDLSQVDHTLIARVSGDLGLRSNEAFERELTRIVLHHPPVVVIDLSGVPMIASICMGALVAVHRSLSQNRASLRLTGLRPDVLEAFRRARLHTFFDIRPTITDSLSA